MNSQIAACFSVHYLFQMNFLNSRSWGSFAQDYRCALPHYRRGFHAPYIPRTPVAGVIVLFRSINIQYSCKFVRPCCKTVAFTVVPGCRIQHLYTASSAFNIHMLEQGLKVYPAPAPTAFISVAENVFRTRLTRRQNYVQTTPIPE